MTELQIINKRLDDLEKRIDMLDKEANKILFIDAVSKIKLKNQPSPE